MELGGMAFSNRQAALDWIHSEFRFDPATEGVESPDRGRAAAPGGAVPVSQVFDDGRLAQWALGDPDNSLMRQLAHAASTLDALMRCSAGGGGVAGPGTRQAVTQVLCILDELSAPRV